MSDERAVVSSCASRSAASLTVAATYFYFLIFAEFAFLELVHGIAPTAGQLRLVMFALGFGGVLGAVTAAIVFRTPRGRVMLTWTLRACGAAGLLALAARSLPSAVLVAALAGAGLGAVTVTLALMLSGAMGQARLGFGIGAGTGVAYALCNIPEVFHASPAWQTVFAVMAVLGASFLPKYLGIDDGGRISASPHSHREVLRWIAILLALVWLDSAAFYIVQHTPAFRAATWNSAGTLWANAAMHLGAALIAGLWLDRGGRAPVAGIALGALVGAALILNGALPAGLSANLFYTAGVSLYSVILVEFPARAPRPAVAALVFIIAGWAGSALGIGMAQDLARIPTGFVVVTVATVVLALSSRFRFLARAGLAVGGLIATTTRADDIALGREVYIAEGCLHCHSQYLRPRVASEVLNWGPPASLGEMLAAAPPLLGTRRQGPDLSRVGNRRSPEWNRLHLIAPQTVSPGSRMPSYAHLFEVNDPRGDALLAYLASLGADTMAGRQQQVAAWKPFPPQVIDPKAASKLFTRLCAACHGETGRGDGILAGRLSLRPPDWVTMPWRRVSDGDGLDGLDLALSRVIKFGLPGVPMAGHEYLPDGEIVGLARHVQLLHKASDSGSALPSSHENPDRGR